MLFFLAAQFDSRQLSHAENAAGHGCTLLRGFARSAVLEVEQQHHGGFGATFGAAGL